MGFFSVKAAIELEAFTIQPFVPLSHMFVCEYSLQVAQIKL